MHQFQMPSRCRAIKASAGQPCEFSARNGSSNCGNHKNYVPPGDGSGGAGPTSGPGEREFICSSPVTTNHVSRGIQHTNSWSVPGHQGVGRPAMQVQCAVGQPILRQTQQLCVFKADKRCPGCLCIIYSHWGILSAPFKHCISNRLGKTVSYYRQGRLE
jgi:hypothetical protein